MSGSLVSIGAFADVVGMPSSALRYYDEVGVLPPAHVDPVTGYRFYDAMQVRRARLVGALRELGLSVAVMRSLLGADDTVVAERLRQLAVQRTVDAGRGAELLRLMAAGLEAVGAGATVAVDAAYLKAVMGRVARVAGEGPLAAVQLVVGEDGVAMLASDRYQLARWWLRAAASPEGDAVGLIPVVDVGGLSTWLDAETSVTCRICDGAVSFVGSGSDFVCQPHRADFPDLATVYTARAPRGHYRRIIAPAEADGGGEVMVLTIDAHQLELSRSLVDSAIASLVGDEVLVLVDNPEAPVLFRYPGQPDHDVLVMTRQRRGPDGSVDDRR